MQSRIAAVLILVGSTLGVPALAASGPQYDSRGFEVVAGVPLAPRTADFGIFSLVPGNLYFTDWSSNAILQVTPDGTFAASKSLSGYTSGLKGTAFGPDGRLYVVAVTAMGYDVLVLNAQGNVDRTYGGSLYVQGNLSYGKIAVDRNQQFYVAGQSSLVAHRKNTGGRRDIYQGNQVFDVATLSNGNLLVATAYTVVEITSDGSSVVRQLPGFLTDVRGIAVRESSRDLFITMLGSSSAFFQLMRVNLDTGVVQRQTTFVYGDDIAFMADGQLVVGSRTQAPGVFNDALEQLRSFGTEPSMFVSVMPEPMFLFRDEFEE